MSFPDNFVWGAAAASYQIEGAYNEDGRGLSVWDAFCRRPGAIQAGDTGDIASDHYHRYREDVQLMKSIGLMAYRLSISWSRVLPAGVGKINQAGLGFYDKLIDNLLENNIAPFVTLFHWDLPLELYYRGGWLNRESADWFAEYTEAVTKILGDRVHYWMTFNEPPVFTEFGYITGIHAPGERWPVYVGWRIAHNVLRSHGRATQVIRANVGEKAKVGMAGAGRIAIPQSASEADIDAARAYNFDTSQPTIWHYNWWCDPIMYGRYPADGLKAVAQYLPDQFEKDMDTIHQPYDYFGWNIYSGIPVTAAPAGADKKYIEVPFPVGQPQTSFHWPVTPEVMYWGSRLLYERYRLPIFVTENGLSNNDWVSTDGAVHDPQRIDFTKRYLRELGRAHADGVPIGGYFHWSIIDNFEWAEGMRHRFGLVHVDYPTQKRTLKDSARWYKDVIGSNGAVLDKDK